MWKFEVSVNQGKKKYHSVSCEEGVKVRDNQVIKVNEHAVTVKAKQLIETDNTTNGKITGIEHLVVQLRHNDVLVVNYLVEDNKCVSNDIYHCLPLKSTASDLTEVEDIPHMNKILKTAGGHCLLFYISDPQSIVTIYLRNSKTHGLVVDSVEFKANQKDTSSILSYIR